MTSNSEATPLYWEATYEIVLRLVENYPDVDVENTGIEQLYRWIIELPGFADDLTQEHENILNDILCEWYEEISIL